MLDYTKFTLKPAEEILSVIKENENFLILNCAKCFKEFTVSGPDDDCGELMKLISGNNKKLKACLEVDFLCNEIQTEKKLKKTPGLVENSTVLVNSCGLGIQAVAGMLENHVYAVANSVPQGGYHGMALSPEKCDACANCVLTCTGGICPITTCSKSLMNGSCGGPKNGKCEVSPEKDCGWEKIYKRLESLGSVEKEISFFNIRNYNKPDFKTSDSFNKKVRGKRLESFYGGVYPEENKESTREMAITPFRRAETAVIPLSQHTGHIAEPLVKAGDRVKTGQKIGESKSYISAKIHSSVTGEVLAVEPRKHPLVGTEVLSVIIKNSGTDEFAPAQATDYEKLTKDQIINAIHENGIVGLGGAQFPAYVKLKPPKPVDTLILNGCECEPFVTADFRLMIEKADEIIDGAKILMKTLGVNRCIIAVEENKPEAVKLLGEKTAGTGIEVMGLKTKYPQGAEKVLIKRTLGREIPKGGLPLDVGVVVNNVGTAYAVSNALRKNEPLYRRAITVAGDCCVKPGNYEVRLGTMLDDIIKECFDFKGRDLRGFNVRFGGPMMGVLQANLEVPVIKGTTCVLVTSVADIENNESRACIKCGRCMDVCPVELKPLYYGLYAKNNMFAEADKYDVKSCFECGCCEYVCPSKIALVAAVKKIKKNLSK